jgi:hypothetical protein
MCPVSNGRRRRARNFLPRRDRTSVIAFWFSIALALGRQ